MQIKIQDSNSQSLIKDIFIVAGPTTLHILLEGFYYFIDSIWIGFLGAEALAAIAAASFIIWILFSFAELVEVGVNSLVGRYFGAIDKNSIYQTATIGLRYSIFIGFLFIVLSYFFLDDILTIMHLKQNVIVNLKSYLWIIILGFPLFAINLVLFSIFRGVGDAKTPLLILIFSLILNSFLTPLMMFGLIGFPKMYISGAALASVISYSLATFISFFILKKRNLIAPKVPFDFQVIKKITKIGLPLTLNGVFFSIVYILLTKILANYGTDSIAALGIGHRIESICYSIAVGLSIASTTLVSQSLGRKDRVKAEKTVWQIIYYNFIIMFILSLVIIIFNDSLVGLFTNDVNVTKITKNLIFIMALFQVFLGLEVILAGVFSGISNTLPPIIIGFPLNLIRVPLAYFMGINYGVNGIWWTIGLTTFVKGSLLLFWFKSLKLSVNEKY